MLKNAMETGAVAN